MKNQYILTAIRVQIAKEKYVLWLISLAMAKDPAKSSNYLKLMIVNKTEQNNNQLSFVIYPQQP